MAEQHAVDVQAELQGYLNKKNVNQLFIQICENLLIEKPDNPIRFIIEYLEKRFPDQARPPQRTPARPMAISESKASIFSQGVEDEPEEETDTDEEDEDDVADLPELGSNPKPHRGNRRVSVSAESTNPSNLKAEIKVVPKSDADKESILHIISDCIILKHLDSDQKDSVASAMEKVQKPSGTELIRQGDDGDFFYIIESGTVDVFVRSGDQEHPGANVCSYASGDAFGELAIMYNAPRAATCIATSDVALWALDRQSFRTICMTTATSKRTLHRSFLQHVNILSSLNEFEILTIADALVEEEFKDGEEICTQGEMGNKFYLVKKGEAICYQLDAAGAEVEVARITSGQYFGEICLLTSKPRQATVRANGPLSCLSLDRGAFKRVMGPLEDILKRNMELFYKIQAQNIY